MSPQAGWIRAVREALGMTAADLRARLHVSRQAVYALEAGRGGGNGAEALGCHLLYALIPNSTLQTTVETEAGRLVDAWASRTAQSMQLGSRHCGVCGYCARAMRRWSDSNATVMRSTSPGGKPRAWASWRQPRVAASTSRTIERACDGDNRKS